MGFIEYVEAKLHTRDTPDLDTVRVGVYRIPHPFIRINGTGMGEIRPEGLRLVIDGYGLSGEFQYHMKKGAHSFRGPRIWLPSAERASRFADAQKIPPILDARLPRFVVQDAVDHFNKYAQTSHAAEPVTHLMQRLHAIRAEEQDNGS